MHIQSVVKAGVELQEWHSKSTFVVSFLYQDWNDRLAPPLSLWMNEHHLSVLTQLSTMWVLWSNILSYTVNLRTEQIFLKADHSTFFCCLRMFHWFGLTQGTCVCDEISTNLLTWVAALYLVWSLTFVVFACWTNSSFKHHLQRWSSVLSRTLLPSEQKCSTVPSDRSSEHLWSFLVPRGDLVRFHNKIRNCFKNLSHDCVS